MAVSFARTATSSIAGVKTQRCAAVKPATSNIRTPKLSARKCVLPAPVVSSAASKMATKATPVEIAQLAGEGPFITATALTMVAMTLIGLAFGFVLLRVESLVEEGKI